MKNSWIYRNVLLKLYFLLKDIIFLLGSTWNSFKRLHIWVAIICWFRYVFYAKILRRLKFHSLEGDLVGKNTIPHNYKGLSLLSINAFSGSRPFQLFSILNTIQSIDKKNAKVLIIGPRAESEFFIGKSFGFKIKNMTGLDLISYSPWVKLGDMHNTPFEDNSFDVIVLGWVLAYSNNPPHACKEILRIARNNAVIITGVQYMKQSVEEVSEMLGYTPGADVRISSNDAINEWFQPNIDHVFYNHDVTKIIPDEKSELIYCFNIKK